MAVSSKALAYQPPFANTLTLGNTLFKVDQGTQPPFYDPLYKLADAFDTQADVGNLCH